MQPIDLGTRRELFVDDTLIAGMTAVRLDLKHPERRELFTFDAPWEGPAALASSVVADRGVVRLYYRASILDAHDVERMTVMALAESHDGGLSFVRPSLGLYKFQGSRDNNIIGIGFPGAPPAFLDVNPDASREERYKGFGAFSGLPYALCSADGIRWRLMQEAPLDYPGAFDTVNTAFWDTVAGCYRSYTRVWINRETPEGLTRIRCIQSAVSPDFIHWAKPVENVYADGDDYVHLYTNLKFPPDFCHDSL